MSALVFAVVEYIFTPSGVSNMRSDVKSASVDDIAARLFANRRVAYKGEQMKPFISESEMMLNYETESQSC